MLRIGIPFGVGLLVLFPLVIAGATFSNTAKTASIDEAWAAVVRMAATPELYVPTLTIHLWFLNYLLYFYAFALLLVAASAYVPPTWRELVRGRFGAVVSRPVLRVGLPSLVTAVTLLPMGGFLLTSPGFVPDLAVLVAYGIFFGFGWLLYAHREVVPSFDRFASLQTGTAIALYFAIELLVIPRLGETQAVFFTVVVRSLTGVVVVWMLFFGLTGLFLRYLDRPSARTRYVVDASYWVYLVHLPCTLWVPGLLVGTELSVWLRILTVLGATAVLGFGSYALFVRSSWIGLALNGRRYPRRLPVMVSVGA